MGFLPESASGGDLNNLYYIIYIYIFFKKKVELRVQY